MREGVWTAISCVVYQPQGRRLILQQTPPSGAGNFSRSYYACSGMNVFMLIIIALPILNAVWWRWADLRLRGLPHASRWRSLLAAFVAGNFAIYVWVLLSRIVGLHGAVPVAVLGTCYIWHLVVLPATIVCVAAAWLIRMSRHAIARLARSLHTRAAPDSRPETTGDPADPPGSVPAPVLTRRQVLAASIVAVPPLATAVGQIRALSQLDSFRIRHLTIGLPTLPAALDGLTIAHVSDIHVGRFTNGPILREVVARTNALRPDLVLFTGDLIDHALADLPAGLDVLRRLLPPQRLFMCEGNHDLFEGREEFERRVRAAGVPLLLDESAVLEIRGRSVQILGLCWGRLGDRHGSAIDDHLERVLPLRRPAAFTILLAHHPHAFDRAADVGVPLTLAGHTHGGQLMLTGDIGAGPLLFKYCSGLYRRGDSALVVSNGVGNWFPLRVNAPAEIIHLTLRAAGQQT